MLDDHFRRKTVAECFPVWCCCVSFFHSAHFVETVKVEKTKEEVKQEILPATPEKLILPSKSPMKSPVKSPQKSPRKRPNKPTKEELKEQLREQKVRLELESAVCVTYRQA